jgi:hypothetical protein
MRALQKSGKHRSLGKRNLATLVLLQFFLLRFNCHNLVVAKHRSMVIRASSTNSRPKPHSAH